MKQEKLEQIKKNENLHGRCKIKTEIKIEIKICRQCLATPMDSIQFVESHTIDIWIKKYHENDSMYRT